MFYKMVINSRTLKCIRTNLGGMLNWQFVSNTCCMFLTTTTAIPTCITYTYRNCLFIVKYKIKKRHTNSCSFYATVQLTFLGKKCFFLPRKKSSEGIFAKLCIVKNSTRNLGTQNFIEIKFSSIDSVAEKQNSISIKPFVMHLPFWITRTPFPGVWNLSCINFQSCFMCLNIVLWICVWGLQYIQ